MTRRREFLKLAGAATAVLAGCSRAEDGDPESRAPRNVILITGDDLGWKDLASSGNPNVRTPNLDWLQRGGVSFRRAFDVTSTCSSSRATYATGQFPHTHGVTGLVHRLPELSLPEGTATLASHLKAAGLLTAIEGKWHVAHPRTADAYGYDEVMASLLTQWITDSVDTVDFITRFARRRFYFEINYMNPHRNYLGGFEQDREHPVDASSIVIPEYMRLPDVPGVRQELAAYYSQINKMDAMIGDVVAALEAQKLLDETLIAFISDNGAPFPGNKLNLYDRGTGTPMFFYWPRGFPAGVARDDLVSSVDLMPTLLDAVGVAVPKGVQGRSLMPFLRDSTLRDDRGAVFSEMTRHESDPFPMRSVRTDRFRYIRNYNDSPVPMEGDDQAWVAEVLAENLPGYRWTARRVPEELYDLASDPHEQSNLVDSAAHASTLSELRVRLDAHMAATSDPYLGRAFERAG